MSFLPIGSIVLLKGATKQLMIVGYMANDVNNEEKDYMAVPYPEGILSEESVISFNNGDIETTLYKGFENEIFEKFISKLNNNIENK